MHIPTHLSAGPPPLHFNKFQHQLPPAAFHNQMQSNLVPFQAPIMFISNQERMQPLYQQLEPDVQQQHQQALPFYLNNHFQIAPQLQFQPQLPPEPILTQNAEAGQMQMPIPMQMHESQQLFQYYEPSVTPITKPVYQIAYDISTPGYYMPQSTPNYYIQQNDPNYYFAQTTAPYYNNFMESKTSTSMLQQQPQINYNLMQQQQQNEIQPNQQQQQFQQQPQQQQQQQHAFTSSSFVSFEPANVASFQSNTFSNSLNSNNINNNNGGGSGGSMSNTSTNSNIKSAD
jgi:hypothetical protein